jgi:hypothetical protein
MPEPFTPIRIPSAEQNRGNRATGDQFLPQAHTRLSSVVRPQQIVLWFVDYARTLWYISTMKVLNLRGLPDDLIRRAKAAAALEGITLKDWVMKAIDAKLKKQK